MADMLIVTIDNETSDDEIREFWAGMDFLHSTASGGCPVTARGPPCC